MMRLSASFKIMIANSLTPRGAAGQRYLRRRGSAYLVVLGVTMIVSALAYSGILISRSRNRAAADIADAADARQYAQDAIEVGRLWIANDANWRTTRTSGVWATNVPIGEGTFTLSGIDPADGDLANFPHEPVVLKATAIKGNARHVIEATIVAKPEPLPSLRFAVHTGGQFKVLAGKTLSAAGATVSTNGTLANSGTIVGNIDVLLALPLGTVTGTTTIGGTAKPLPSASIVDQYMALGTVIVTTSIDKRAIGPGYNPYGTANPYGIYVVRPGGDLTIRNSHICGTLVVDAPGKNVIIDGNVLLHPHRSDCPALIIDGNAEIMFVGGTSALDEGFLSTNLNPPGVPYEGAENSKANDKLPSEIQGLVHVTGKLALKQSPIIRGAIMVNSTAILEAVKVEDAPQIIYTPGLLTSPPSWYTLSVPMETSRGTWRQSAN